jgi:hypothetical protein
MFIQHQPGSSVRERSTHRTQVSQKVGLRGHYKNNIIARFLTQQSFQKQYFKCRLLFFIAVNIFA